MGLLGGEGKLAQQRYQESTRLPLPFVPDGYRPRTVVGNLGVYSGPVFKKTKQNNNNNKRRPGVA